MLINNLLLLAPKVKKIQEVDFNNPTIYTDAYWHNKIPSAWYDAVYPNIPHTIIANGNREILRSKIIALSESIHEKLNVENKKEIKIFILSVLLWGYGDKDSKKNVGKIFTTPNNIITQDEHDEKIVNIFKEAFICVKNNSYNCIEDAFDKLKVIKGLGMSFISKYLYFIGKPIIKPKYPLIFDNKVNRALMRLSMTLENWVIVSEMSEMSRGEKWKNYKSYLDLIHYVSKVKKVEPDQYEYFLFKKVFNDQGEPEDITGIA